MRVKILSVLFVPLAAVLVHGTAVAQVTIDMTTTQATNCTARTDANGLQLVPGSVHLSATGVTLTGDGCGNAGTPGDFGTSITVPGTVTLPAAITVGYASTADATRCMFGGATNANGWPVGSTVACGGSGCSGSKSVTLPSAGTYTFSMLCSNETGYAGGSVVASGTTGSPPTPSGFALSAPASATANVPFNVAWTVNDATSCTGTADLNGSSTSLPGWTNITTATSPRTVTAAAAGTYTLRLTCSNQYGQAISAPATVVVTADSAGCPAGRLTTADVIYNNNANQIRRNVDLTQWDNVWGHYNNTDTVTTFPGVVASSPYFLMPRASYVAAHFNTGNANAVLGKYKNNLTNPGLSVTISISQQCGDFGTQPTGCKVEGAFPNDSLALSWRIGGQVTAACVLQPNTDYYLNIKNTDPTQDTSYCPVGSPACKVHVFHNWSVSQ